MMAVLKCPRCGSMDGATAGTKMVCRHCAAEMKFAPVAPGDEKPLGSIKISRRVYGDHTDLVLGRLTALFECEHFSTSEKTTMGLAIEEIVRLREASENQKLSKNPGPPCAYGETPNQRCTRTVSENDPRESYRICRICGWDSRVHLADPQPSQDKAASQPCVSQLGRTQCENATRSSYSDGRVDITCRLCGFKGTEYLKTAAGNAS